MFSSLRVKLQQILNPFHRRSASICVQSKAKKVQSKRDVSLTKINAPVQIDFTPKKIPTADIRYDELETISKQTVPIQGMATRVLENNRNQDGGEMLVSDIESGGCDSDRLLLPSLDGFSKEKIGKCASRKPSKNSEQNKISRMKLVIRSNTLPEEQTAPEIQFQPTQAPKPQFQKQNTLINWLEQNKPEYFMIKLNKQESNKPTLTSQLKQKRLHQYNKTAKQQAKNNHHSCCMICEQPAPIRQSIQLACTHRIHKICAQIVKWKPKMKCNVCERKSIGSLGISSEKIKVERRLSQIKQSKKE